MVAGSTWFWVKPTLDAEAFTQHFVCAARAEWQRQEEARPGSWPEDQQVKITFHNRPGFFLTIVLCALRGNADLYVPGVDAIMTLAATGYRVERWCGEQDRYVSVEAQGNL